MTLNESDTKALETAENIATVATGLISGLAVPLGCPPAAVIAGVIGAYLKLTGSLLTLIDKGFGVYLTLPWLAIYPFEQLWLIIPTPVQSGPQILATSGLTTWVSATDNLQHVAYVDQNGHVQELYQQIGQTTWNSDDVTATAKAPDAQQGALTSWLSTTDNLQHIAYIGTDGHVHELYMKVGVQPWQTDDVTATTKAPNAQQGALTSWLSATDNLQHIAYIGTDGHVHELYMEPGAPPWQTDDVTAAAKAPDAQQGALTSWLSTTDNLQHIAYVGADNHVHELYMKPGAPPWQTDDVTATAKAPNAQQGSAHQLALYHRRPSAHCMHRD